MKYLLNLILILLVTIGMGAAIHLRAQGIPAGMMLTGTAPTSSPPPSCVNSGSNVCFLLGSFGPDLGSTSWMNRPWDFTDAGIGQNQCNFIAAGYPFEGGTDNPGITGTYQGQIAANSACPNQIYGYKINNEWWLNCNATNPWSTTQTTPGNCSGSGPDQWESVPATVTPATYKSNVCAAVNLARSTYPGIKVSWFGPGNNAEAAYDPSDTCTIDAYEVHIYIYGDCDPNCSTSGRSGKADWTGGTPYSCGVTPNNTVPHDIQCPTTTKLGYLMNYANTSPHIKPLALTEVCDGYNDTTGPSGVSYATWVINELAKGNASGTSVVQWWSGDPDGQGKSDCSFRSGSTNYLNKQAAMRLEFNGSHYAGNMYTYKTLPSPNPYP